MSLTAKIGAALVAACLLPTATSLRAEEVTIAVTGQVTQRIGNDALINAHVNIGDVVTGYYVFDTDTLDVNPSSMRGVYPHALPGNGMFFEINGLEFSTDPAAVSFTVNVNDWGPGRGDTASLKSSQNIYSPGVSAATSSIYMAMTSSDSLTLTSDALTPEALLQPGWFPPSWQPQPRIYIDGANGGTKFQITANVLSVEAVETP